MILFEIFESEMVNELENAQGYFGTDGVDKGLAFVVQAKLKIMDIIDGVVISIGENKGDTVFMFSKDRKALGYACGNDRVVKIDGEKVEAFTISEIALYPNKQKLGFGVAFYKMLLDRGWILMSDSGHTSLGEKLWRKLMKLSGITVTAVEIENGKDSCYKKVDLLARDPWSDSKISIILKDGGEIIDEDTPSVADIPPQPKGLERCTAVTCNALLTHFKKPLINAGSVPHNAPECFDVLQSRGLKVQPDITSPEKHDTVQMFARMHPKGAWFLGTEGHAMALVDGVLYDSYRKGLDARIIKIVAAIVQ